MLVTEQLRASLTKPHLVVCEVDELSSDNPVNHLLVWAAFQLSSIATEPAVRQRLSDLAGRLPSVSRSDVAPTHLVFPLPRQYHHYQGAVELAGAFAAGRGARAGGRSQLGGAGLLVGTERLFESFVERTLDLVVPTLGQDWSVAAQHRSEFATPVDPRRGRPYFSAPDNIVRAGDRAVAIIDAKYKKFSDDDAGSRGRPTNSDLYQMAAACLAHDCPAALLVYPKLSNADPDIGERPVWWQVPFADRPVIVGAVTVPVQQISTPGGLREFDQRIAELVTRVVAQTTASTGGTA